MKSFITSLTGIIARGSRSRRTAYRILPSSEKPTFSSTFKLIERIILSVDFIIFLPIQMCNGVLQILREWFAFQRGGSYKTMLLGSELE
jgi:hypothetical protein